MIVALCALGALGLLALERTLFPSGRAGCDATFEPDQRAPCYVVADYYQAIATQDWARAHSYLARPQRAAITPEALRDDRARRRPVRAFRAELDPIDS